MTVDANTIMEKLMRHLVQSYTIVMPRVFLGMHESDVVCLNKKSNILHEYEIKISKHDFRNDFKKEQERLDFGLFKETGERKWVVRNKHEHLKNGTPDKCTPNKFTFVVPKGLITKEECPEYAGLLYYDDKYKRIEHVKTAKFIHHNLCDPAIRESLFQKAYDRYGSVLRQNISLVQTNRHLQSQIPISAPVYYGEEEEDDIDRDFYDGMIGKNLIIALDTVSGIVTEEEQQKISKFIVGLLKVKAPFHLYTCRETEDAL